MKADFTKLHGNFGALVTSRLSPTDLLDSYVSEQLVEAWEQHGGLLVIRDLTDLTPEQLAAISENFGKLERSLDVSKRKFQVEGLPIQRLGNCKDEAGELVSIFAREKEISEAQSITFDPDTRYPVWHTDSTYRSPPPRGSLFFCKQAPPRGAATCFADTSAAFEALPKDKQAELESLDAICSMAHHDAKVHMRAPTYPRLTEEQRLANPPTRVPLVLKHPCTGRRALYGFNSSTFAVLPQGESLDTATNDECERTGVEHTSADVLRQLLPHCTTPEFTIRWQWREGDLLVWDNFSTIHCATGFDDAQFTREMWRTTVLL
ncbi:hypothetical protein CYMTET_53794 [Cymbomonas tetramitiformis]|uniref:TauD/TfdA-like domain-containing protein n=1 Tax=Cymbomonas tetramitiformis TaxID=36881 RepID=A0AAE0BI22_9CHLO|nr:hypothetical protein CYMTET_53794 [Cymbomonas tetramitiformis]